MLELAADIAEVERVAEWVSEDAEDWRDDDDEEDREEVDESEEDLESRPAEWEASAAA